MYNNQGDFLQERPSRAGPTAWSNQGWFVLRRLRRDLGAAIGGLQLPAAADVLDFGCADSPYRDLLPADVRYVGADLSGNPHASVTIDSNGALPLGDSSADLVLSTQVLEHVADPGLYLRECFRVLRPGAGLVLTTHGFWVYHRDPVDYWRWTADGLRLEAERQGLAVQQIEGIGGLTAIAVQLFQDATRHRVPSWARPLYTFLLQRLAAGFDRLHSDASRRRNAMVLVMVARKPGTPAAG